MSPDGEAAFLSISPLRTTPTTIGFHDENNCPSMPTSETTMNDRTHTPGKESDTKKCCKCKCHCGNPRRGSQVSETWTEQCELEAFSTFRFKVENLCYKLWPDSENIEVQEMDGGSYNRVVGITVHDHAELQTKTGRAMRRIKRDLRKYFCTTSRSGPAETSLPKQYVLRVPRFDDNNVEFDCAILGYVRKHTSIPVPKVVAVDFTEMNPLGQRYVIQERVPGKTLSHVYDELNDCQRASVAREVGKVWLELQKKQYKRAGQLDPKTHRKILNHDMNSYDKKKEKPTSEHEEADKTLNPIEWIFAMCERQKRANSMVCKEHEPWDTFANIANMIDDETDLLMQDGFYLCHGDFEARNMMVEVLDEQTVKITGILDWDLATFAPQVFGCEAPIWLWRWEELREPHNIGNIRDDGMIDIDMDYVPPDPAKNAIKQAFESTVGPEFINMSYPRDSDMLRRIIHCAMYGGFSPSSYLEMWESIRYWLAEHRYELGEELHYKIERVQDVYRRSETQEELSNMEGVNRSENEWLMEY